MDREQKILLITTGGTIGCATDENGARVANNKSATGADLLRSVQEKIDSKKHCIYISTLDAYNIDSSNSNPTHWKQLIHILVDNYEKYDAFVITHGTDTMGYTAIALALGLGNFGKPVLLTGSQVPFLEYGDDARTNLENCVRVIHDSQEKVRGVFVVINSALLAGTRAKKIDDTKYQAFGSYGSFNLAELGATYDISYNKNIVDYMDTYGFKAEKSSELKVCDTFEMDSIFTIPEHPGISFSVIKDIIMNEKVRAIVWRGYGVGNTNVLSDDILNDPKKMKRNFLDSDLRSIFKLAQSLKKPIIMTSDVEKSNVTMSSYTPGIIALTEYGIIPTFDMSPAAATVKAAYLLANNVPYEQFKAAMLDNIRGEIDPIKVKRFQKSL